MNDTSESEMDVRRYADPYFLRRSLADGPDLSFDLCQGQPIKIPLCNDALVAQQACMNGTRARMLR